LGAGARDAPARHQTLRATIDWSYDLLTDDEKACFARFAVFTGAPTVDAAEAITGADIDTLYRLVAKSLIVRRQSAQARTRLGMLETIRAYANEKLAAAADERAVRERHHGHYLALAEDHGTDRALGGTSHREHLAQLDAEIDNLHGALRWAVGYAAEPALTLCAALGWYWLMRHRNADAVEWGEQAVSLPGADAHPALRVRVLCIIAWGLWPLGRAAEHPAVAAEAEAIARRLGDASLLSQVLELRAVHESAHVGRLDVAETLADEALQWASAAGDDWAIAKAASALAMAAQSVAELRKRVEVAASLLDRAGNVHDLADLLASASYAALTRGSDHDAIAFVGRAIPLAERLDVPFLWMLVRGNSALAALLTGDIDTARHGFREELKLCRELVVLPVAYEGLQGLAAVATVDGDVHRAARLSGAAAAHRYGQPEDALDARLRATFLDPARIRHGADAWDARAQEGAAHGFAHAIAYALGEVSA
jgi:hypothetical protein